MFLAPIGAVGPRLLDFSNSDSVQEMAVGTPILAAGTMFSTTSNVANWGHCELLYVRYASSTVINPGRLVHVDKNFTIADVPNTAGTGKNLYVTLTNFTDGSSTTQYGWVLRAGICPIQYAVAATTGLVYVGGAGQATPTQANGKQVLNASCLIAAASTFTRTGKTVNGQSGVTFANVAGMFVGQAISGTGIPASSVISGIDPGGRVVYIGSAIGTLVTATASGSVTVTMTNTGYGICQVDRGFVQGQVA